MKKLRISGIDDRPAFSYSDIEFSVWYALIDGIFSESKRNIENILFYGMPKYIPSGWNDI